MTHQANLSTLDIWGERVDRMGLTVEGSPMWPAIQKLYAELADAGIDLRPPCYVASEWGCPDGQPLIGVPFYLCDARFFPLEEDYADDLEEGERLIAGLRHEAGHAVSYAHKLYQDPEFQEVFGLYSREYKDDYEPLPFSPKHVRHLPGWYAQKHPDEDFAETFAVWLTPGSSWRERYAGTEVLRKLEFVDRIMARVGKLPPLVDPASCHPDPDELAFTVAEFYARRTETDAAPVGEIGSHLDDDLRELFSAEGIGTDAATLLRERRRQVMRTVSGFTGARMYLVKSILDTLSARARALALRAVAGREIDALIGVTALTAALADKFLRFGHLI